MKISELSPEIQAVVKERRKEHVAAIEKMGGTPNEESDDLQRMFVFENTPEGNVYWLNLQFAKNAPSKS